MKQLITGFFMSWGMFCAIPCPYKHWDEKARPMMLVLFPILGLVIGGLWALIGWGVSKVHLGLLGFVIMAAVPWLVSGFIHLDGYMDCCDAILSRRDLAERQRILKDSHTGAFAVICVCLLMLVQTGAFSLFTAGEKLLPLILIPAATRACAGAAVMSLRAIGHSSYSASFCGNVRPGHRAACFVLLGIVIAAACVLFGLRGVCVPAAAAGYWLAVAYGYRQLGGMSGDISGFALTVGEAVGIIVLCVI